MRARLFLEAFGVRAALLNAELPLNSRHHILQVGGLARELGVGWSESGRVGGWDGWLMGECVGRSVRLACCHCKRASRCRGAFLQPTG